jgi:hypothetical protein
MRVTLSPSESGLSMIKHMQHPGPHQSIMGCFNAGNVYPAQVVPPVAAPPPQQYILDASGIQTKNESLTVRVKKNKEPS